MYWTKRLGSIGLVVGFVGVLVFTLVSPQLNEWVNKMDMECFYLSRTKKPTSGFLAIAGGALLGAVFACVGFIVDKVSSPKQ